MKAVIKGMVVSYVLSAVLVVQAALEQEVPHATQEQPIYLTAGMLFDFQQEMDQSIMGDLILEHEKELEVAKAAHQEKLQALKLQLEAEHKNEHEIFAQLKIERDRFDREMEELFKKHGDAQHAKRMEFISGIGAGEDRDWPQDAEQAVDVSGSDDGEEDWDKHFLAASIADTKQAGDL